MRNSNNIDHNSKQAQDDQLNLIDSILSVKCSGLDMETQIQQDLNLPEGKTIAELLYDQEENRPTT